MSDKEPENEEQRHVHLDLVGSYTDARRMFADMLWTGVRAFGVFGTPGGETLVEAIHLFANEMHEVYKKDGVDDVALFTALAHAMIPDELINSAGPNKPTLDLPLKLQA